jgi:hypothetical protein
MHFEEIIKSQVVLQLPSGGVRELSSDLEECNEGSVGHEAGGFIITLYTPGAYPDGEDCQEMGLILACAHKFEMDWPRVFRVDQHRLVEVRMTRRGYEDLASRYRRSAAELDSFIRGNAMFPGTSETYATICGTGTVQRMRHLADSALALARGLPER